jgi:hypothetical protein
MTKYFPKESVGVLNGTLLELRATIALCMLEKWGAVMGKDGAEDSTGRAKIVEMTPKETVERAFAISEEFVRVCEEKEYLKICAMTE